MDFSYKNATLGDGLRISYIDEKPPQGETKGVIVLIHGFPQTSYQFRKVIQPLVSAGYRVIAPDYRGAGLSSKPPTDFRKTTMANDILLLLDHLSVAKPVHVVGHDIGGMLAHALATRHPARVASLVWGECPLPGTRAHLEDRTTHAAQQFHVVFHCVPDLPEALVSGREEAYLNHFFDGLSYCRDAISREDVAWYVDMYRRPGALRCAFVVYAAFTKDAEENEAWVREKGKCAVRTLGVSGGESRHRLDAAEMFGEVHREGTFRVVEVPDSGHYVAVENPEGFVKVVLEFIEE
ncbi:alpha beta hydrolase fold protein [Colletotrichum plurivorum]|uniref:Alpha beta hydrolase fold protein n=1 Tax=Colletotrichum plurivorum TaxID=2175906 RepID=A0A8H6N9B0_9PEZI|nr:alpha beta hydrolase fold protein [Colletotrichum plurivorum]